VKRVARQLVEYGAVNRGYLGVQLSQSIEPADALKLGLEKAQGAWIESVYPDTPAAVAGLQPNDVILRVDAIEIRNENHLINLIASMPEGQRVKLHVWREKKPRMMEAVVGDWSKAPAKLKAEK
jgi:serine protease Do